MTKLEIDSTDLVIHVQGLDRLWSLKSELRVPVAHVAGAERATEEARAWYHGLRAPGTNVPGVITAGTFYEHGGRVFWDVHDPERAIAIRLHDERYARLVIEVENPETEIAIVETAISAARITG